MRVSFGAVALLLLLAAAASGQQAAGPRLPSSRFRRRAESPNSGAATTKAPVPIRGAQPLYDVPVDSEDPASCNDNVLVAGAVGAALGAVWGYNRDQHTVDQGFIPHGGLIVGLMLGGWIGMHVVMLYNAVTHCGSAPPSG